MSLSKIHLSAAAISHLSIENFDCNFSFVIGSEIVKFPVYIAEFLSPIISRNLSQDSNFDSFSIENDIDLSVFRSLLDLFQGKKVDFYPHQIRQLILLSESLKSVSLKELLLKSLHSDEQICSLLFDLVLTEFREETPSDEGIATLAQKSHSISSFSFSILSPQVLFSIFSHPDLRISSEDDFCLLIRYLIQTRGNEFLILLETIQTKYLSQKVFLDLIDSLHYTEIGTKFWGSLIERMKFVQRSLPLDSKRWIQKTTVPTIIEQPFPKPETGHDGIFHGLLDKYTRDIFKTKVCVTASTSTLHKPLCVLEWVRDKQWVSHDEEHQWIKISLRAGLQIKLTHYQLHSHGGPSFLTSWILEGSLDEGTWASIDQRNDEGSLSSPNAEDCFECRTVGTYSTFRFTMNGLSAHRDHVFCLRGIEFYGMLISPPENIPAPVTRERPPRYP